MENEKKKSDLSVLLGAAFLMATSAIGPGFLTQTAKFTSELGPTMGFVILISVVMSWVAQQNVWRIICVSKMKGQDIANTVLPGLGHFVAILVALGGLAFNIGNIGGAGLGMNVIFGIDAKIGAAISAIIAIAIFASKSAGKAMDKLTQILGALMIIVILVVVFISQPPVGEAVYRTFVPDHFPVLAIVTLVGGTVGGYITFSGGHRLLDAGVSGEENLGKVTRSATTGMGVATIVRILFFLAVLGVVSKGMQLDPKNPPASAFQLAAGTMGYKFFGIVLLAAAISSVVGAAYTSVSFLTSMSKAVKERQNLFVIAFITVSTLIFIFIGNPVKLLIVAGSLNGLILPITLGAMLLASRNKKIVGDYKHPTFLLILGVIVVVVVAYLGIKSLSGLSKLFVPAK
ncbi:NRAMP family divalent metal transporter [Criibacterium bergeronii]|uniref:Divalent metal cation transporter n=1 Tax=Criibacterium bergeronii TaxID=1871336 RepID=A0A371IPA0_9FIRM|nr:NRAMP family divalent metal transporter [Criibacterium bergeronii]MBS6063465.1 divalent metal cation transporter [Peptostreptococcaceae bacterium]RDY22313.1 divalent metal cation transporter [Criibacterium bergeronii]TRW25466.1 divalent metal cation transporter [Criibacterium bergeronii]